MSASQTSVDAPASSVNKAERRPVFVTTQWSVVLAAQDKESPQSAQALEELCGAYWYPLYAYVRRCGRSPADAEDLTQAFFARFLEKDWLVVADPDRGKFRSFLLASLKHFLANEHDKMARIKRGGRVQSIPLDAVLAETRYQREPVDEVSPDKIFERQWAVALLDLVLHRLHQEYAAQGKGALFEHLRSTLSGERASIRYAEMATQLHTTEGAIKVAVHRLRLRYREILREEIAQTVESPSQVEAELRHLFAALSS